MDRERIEAAAKLAWEKDRDFRLSGRWDTLPQYMRDQVMSDIRWYVSAWLEAGECNCEACTRPHASDCNVHNAEERTADGCTCGAWPSDRSDCCHAEKVCAFCGGEV